MTGRWPHNPLSYRACCPQRSNGTSPTCRWSRSSGRGRAGRPPSSSAWRVIGRTSASTTTRPSAPPPWIPLRFVAALPRRVTLDEIQRVPQLLPAIKRSVDQDREPGRFLLTGSANLLLLPKVTESLAGRMAIADLQPLTEAEKEGRPGQFLRLLLDGGCPASHRRRLGRIRPDP